MTHDNPLSCIHPLPPPPCYPPFTADFFFLSFYFYPFPILLFYSCVYPAVRLTISSVSRKRAGLAGITKEHWNKSPILLNLNEGTNLMPPIEWIQRSECTFYDKQITIQLRFNYNSIARQHRSLQKEPSERGRTTREAGEIATP